MRKIVLYMFTTLDGFTAGPNGEFDDYEPSVLGVNPILGRSFTDAEGASSVFPTRRFCDRRSDDRPVQGISKSAMLSALVRRRCVGSGLLCRRSRA